MKLKYFLFLFLTLTIIHQTSSIATVRYVSKTGTSTPPYTTWQTAADSIQKCINICLDGDTIYVANGIYKENLIINTAISLIGSSMDSTVIDGKNMGDITINVNNVSKIENFNIIGKYEGSFGTRGIRSYTDIEVYNCQITETGLAIGFLGNSIQAKNLILKNLTTRGISIYPNSNSSNFVSNCVVLLDKPNSNAIEIGLNGTYYIDNNILMYNNEFESAGNGISCGWPKKVYIRNNFISGFLDNIFFDIVDDTAFITNNILNYQNTTGSSASIWSSGNKIFVKNSVLSKNNKGIYQIGSGFIESDYNLFWNNAIDVVGLNYGDSDILADPMFVYDTIPTANGSYDYHLQKYSPAIDKGDPAILDVDGSRSDIGMFGGPLGESYTYQDLAPKPPRNLTASMDSGLVHLKWNKNTEADLFRYRVYRDTIPDFIYDTTKIIAVISDTTFYDDPPQKFIAGNYYYKITAIDSAYHQSPASEEAHISITGIPEAPPIVVEHYNLLQNYPNPFNPSTTIPYRLKAPGYVKVLVYNLLGEQVKVLVNKYQSAGYYEVLFHPTATERQSAEGKIEFETGYGDIVSGIYLYRIEVIGEGNIPVFTDMKKMMLVK